VEVAEQVIEREDVSRVVAIPLEHDVRPATHPRRRVALVAEPQLVPGDGANEHALVARPRKRPHGKEVRPRAERADTIVRGWTVVELEERRRRAAHDRFDEPERSRIADAGDRRPEMIRDTLRDLTQRETAVGRSSLPG